MKRKITVIIVLPIISIILLSGCTMFQPYEGNLTVSGQITDFNNGDPLDNVKVEINDQVTYTNFDGKYQTTVLVNGYLKWNAFKEGYLIEEPIEKYVFSESSIIINKPLKNIKDYTGSISGEVIYPSITSQQASLTGSKPVSQLQTIPRLHTGQSLNESYVQGEILLKLRPGIRTQELSPREDIIEEIESPDGIILKIKVPEGMTAHELLSEYQNRDDVEIASFNHLAYLMETYPNDDYFSEQWNLKSINLPQAWDITTGDSSATVAVIDTGYLPHSDLTNNIDDWNGYDFVDNDYTPLDDAAYWNSSNDFRESHGTHISGIIGAIGNNNKGISGVNWAVSIMPLRVFKIDEWGKQVCETADLIKAINYAVDRQADIINLSLAFTSGDSYSSYPLIEETLARAYNAGLTVVAAAGNSKSSSVLYPASSYYTIAVGATGPYDQLASYSNYGVGLDILAPGGDTSNSITNGILSTVAYPDIEDYDYMQGTSMATPHVAGVAALLVSQGIKNPDEIRETLGRSSQPIFDGRLNGVGLLNAEAALKSAGSGLYSELIVMATEKKTGQYYNTYYTLSDQAEVGADGSYYIPHVKTETTSNLTVIAWKDNGDGEIGAGDYFGEEDVPPLDDGQQLRNITITYDYISDNTADMAASAQVVNHPPAVNTK